MYELSCGKYHFHSWNLIYIEGYQDPAFNMYVGTLYVVYLQTIWQTFTANLGSFANVFVEKLFQLDSYLFKKVNVRTDIEKAKIFLWKFI